LEPRGTRDRTEDWLVPPPPPGGDGARVSIARRLAMMEARIDEALTLARGSTRVWEAAEEGMQRIGEIAVLASEQAIEAASAAEQALARATVAESHAERSAAAAAAAAMRAEGLARQQARPSRPARKERERGSPRPGRTRPVVLRQSPREAPRIERRPTRAEAGEDPLRRFSERADRLVARLHDLERHPFANGADAPQ
jgi:hypothetical protein